MNTYQSPTALFRNAPAVWIALAATTGIVVDRLQPIPIPFALALAAASLIAWFIVLPTKRFAAGFLLLTAAALAAAYHHDRVYDLASNEIARLASVEGTPVHLRGQLVAPIQSVPGSDDPLQTIPRKEASKLIVDATWLVRAGATEPIRGRIVAYVSGKVSDAYVGDEIEMHGRLFLPRGPGNPGEFDPAADLRDQGIGAVLAVPATADAVRLVAHRWPASVSGWLGRLHAACKSILNERLTAEPGLAAALLLGDGSGLTRPEWDKFLKSGVVHALAISGQHLVVLATFLSLLRRATFVRLTPATIGITLILVAYALLTGGRPPAMRAAWVFLVFSLAMIVRRPGSLANTFALAWLGVILVNPADIFQTGCQLSFLAVGLLQWAVTPYLNRPSPADLLADLDNQEASADRWWHGPWEAVRTAYLANALIWLGVTPLVAERFHVVSPIALLIGPPVVLATSLALVSGFLLLSTAPLLGPLAAPFAWLTDGSLYACETIIDWGLAMPGASFTLGDLPMAWVILFYLGLLLPFAIPRWQTRWTAAAIAVWLLVGTLFGLGHFRRAEFRVSFLSVGHGGCTVIETSSGRVLVYDAGAMTGPDLTRRIILPYLWSRGHRRIDDLFISHADLDHFSGVPDLLDRFPVTRVTLTPSFADRGTPAVRRVMADLKRRNILTRTIKAGDSEQIDDIKLDVLHPPGLGPDGKENARSLVMLLRKDSFALLLTGDLEDAGLNQVLALRPPRLDILMSPHHGSRLANPATLAAWAKPRIVVSSQGRPRGLAGTAQVYEAVDARFLTTHRDGAIEITLRDRDILLQTFRSKETIRLSPAAVR